MNPATQAALAQFDQVRGRSEALCKPLVTDDYGVQSMPDVSPPKWHLAHTTWFFEEFLLAVLDDGYEPFHERYRYLFNSYYESVGVRVDRSRRGLLSRPSVNEVRNYRAAIERRVRDAFERASTRDRELAVSILLLGCHHEEQHQELLLTDIKHILWSNPLRPSYESIRQEPQGAPNESLWLEFQGGLRQIGFVGESFAFDNESPRHLDARDLRRVPGVHAGRRIRQTRALAFRRLGGRPKGGVGSAALLGAQRQPLVADDTLWNEASYRASARTPRQLL